MVRRVLKKKLLLFNTLKHLKWKQFYFRIYRKLMKPRVTERLAGALPERCSNFVYTALYDEKITRSMDATFLNHTKQLQLPEDWNNESYSKLWVYNLHYFEDLLTENAQDKYTFHMRLLDAWQAQNLEGMGNGWEPYTISLRVPNVIKAWQAGLPLKRKHFESLYAQASYLAGTLEKHLLGNHYFVNLKAILFAGIVFENDRWLNLAVKGLVSEIPEQTLADGANFELTPMYHSLILVDMLDMYNLCQAFPGMVANELVELLKKYIPKMLLFMKLMAHNDDGVSFFNDSVDGIAPQKYRIEDYAYRLGFEVPSFDTSKLQVIDSKFSGYMVAINSGNKLIFDAANVGPDYIPGHAHADTLSFELSIGNERVFVNTGTSEYGLGDKRLNERRTAAHNTVEVDKGDSSQVWSGFRVANRARVIDRSAFCGRTSAILSASHNGYRNIIGGPIHKRTLGLTGNALSVSDELNGSFKTATARFYLHPNLKVSLEGDILKIIGERFKLTSLLTSALPRLVHSTWHPNFGVSQENICVEYDFTGNSHSIEFTWTLT